MSSKGTPLDMTDDAPPLRIATGGGVPSEQVLVSVSGEYLSGLGLISVGGDDREAHHCQLRSLPCLIDLTHLSLFFLWSQVILVVDELKLAAIFDAIRITEIVGNKTAAENTKELQDAIKNHERVILMNYESGHTGLISNREIEPYAFSTNYADVYAYEISTGQNKTFKVSRIGWVKPTCHEWIHKAEHEVISPDCFRMNGKESIPVTLKMTLMAKNLLIEEYPLAHKDITLEDGNWYLRTTVKNLAGVGRFYIGLADQIEIIDSPELVGYIRNHIRNNLARYI